jgi:hypothetical protein
LFQRLTLSAQLFP